MGNEDINIGDIVRVDEMKGDFMVVDNSDPALLTVRAITAALTHRAIPVSQVSLWERG